jgi:hypothetical protein
MSETTVPDSTRAAYIRGLREVAAFLEAHPDLPTPSYGGSLNAFVSTRADLAAIARVRGVKWEKSADPNYFYLQVHFAAGFSYDVNVQRDQVCRRVVTGTRIEPAKPAQVVEEFHWVCDEPLLTEARS